VSITLDIPESVIKSLRVPEGEAEERLRMELAIALYAEGLLSFGKSAQVANLAEWRGSTGSRFAGF